MNWEDRPISDRQISLISSKFYKMNHRLGYLGIVNYEKSWPKIREELKKLNQKQASEVIHHLTSLIIQGKTINAENLVEVIDEQIKGE